MPSRGSSARRARGAPALLAVAVAVALAASALAVVPAAPAAARDGAGAPAGQDRPGRSPAAAGFDHVEAALRERGGRARVLVGVAVAWRPEGHLGASQRDAQRARVNAARDRVEAHLAGTHHVVLRVYTSIPFLALEIGDRALERLRTSDDVASIAPDERVAPALAESVPLVDGPVAHDRGFTGEGYAVAVLDTGVESGHPFLDGRVVAQACFAQHSCPNGQSTQFGPGAGEPCPWAGCHHGTHVAGIVAGRDATATGVAPGAAIISVQVFHPLYDPVACGSPEPCPRAWVLDYTDALDWLHTNHAALVPGTQVASANLSLSGATYAASCDPYVVHSATKAAMENLLSAGIATVVASGNDGAAGAVGAPGCLSAAVTVGATSKSDAVESWSNSAPMVDLLAPGGGIRSSLPGGGSGALSGTSMAAPHVAGAWAVMRQASSAAPPSAIEAALESNGVPVTDARNGVTKPRVELFPALQATLGPCPLDDAGEDDDAPAAGALVVAGQSRSGVRCAGDDDWFLVPGHTGATLTVDLTFTHADGDLALELVGPTGAPVASADGDGDGEHLAWAFTEDGDHHLRVTGGPDASAPYSLATVLAACPPDDRWEAGAGDDDVAAAVGLALPGTRDGVACAGDADAAYVDLEAGGEVTVTVDHGPGRSVDVRLFRWPEEEASVAAGVPATDRTTLVHTPAAAGRYQVLVGPAAGTVPYRLTVTQAAPPVDGPPTVALTAPAGGATVRGAVVLSASASDAEGVVAVEFSVDGSPVGVDTVGVDGWSFPWASAGAGDGGVHTITATATDTAAQTASDAATVTVLSDAVADFDGDGATDPSVYRPANGRWYAEGRPAAIATAPQAGDVPAPGDYDGDGATDPAVYRPADGRWYVQGATVHPRVVAPRPGDVPVPGDYDGDGATDPAVYRPANGRWYVLGRSPVTATGPRAGDVPVPGDYDGDGATDPAVYRPGNGRWYVEGATTAPRVVAPSAGDVPVPGDYHGDGRTDPAVYRPGNGRWYVLGRPWRVATSPGPGDVPVPGDHDGDGNTDPAVYRPATGRWYVQGATTQPRLGAPLPDDVPVPQPPAARAGG